MVQSNIDHTVAYIVVNIKLVVHFMRQQRLEATSHILKL